MKVLFENAAFRSGKVPGPADVDARCERWRHEELNRSGHRDEQHGDAGRSARSRTVVPPAPGHFAAE
jgi:hypothetical protein